MKMKICTNNKTMTSAQYAYDALGRRIRKISYDSVPSVATVYCYSDNWQVPAEKEAMDTHEQNRRYIVSVGGR